MKKSKVSKQVLKSRQVAPLSTPTDLKPAATKDNSGSSGSGKKRKLLPPALPKKKQQQQKQKQEDRDEEDHANAEAMPETTDDNASQPKRKKFTAVRRASIISA